MNKQELIEKIIDLGRPCLDVVELVKQLDEPGKVKVPQLVADWIKKYDLREETLGKQSVFDVFDNLENDSKNGYYKDVKRWIDDNRDLFARAWLDGYEVEKEKRYIVTLKSSEQKLYYHTEDEDYIFSSYDGVFYSGYHTKTDLEKNDMSWVFDCPGMEIQEVE